MWGGGASWDPMILRYVQFGVNLSPNRCVNKVLSYAMELFTAAGYGGSVL